MHVLVFGADPRHEPVLNSLATVSGHHVERVLGGDVGAIDVAEFDALVSAGPVRASMAMLREFLVGGKPVMVIPSAEQGSEAAYELLAVEEDSGGRLMAGFPHRHVCGWRALRERIQDARDQEPQLIRIERRVPPWDESGVVSEADVDELLLGDADLLRWLGADYSEVTCLHTGATGKGVARATVTLVGDGTSEATWSLEAHAGDEECRVNVSCGGDSFSVEPDAGSKTADECAAELLADVERVAGGAKPEAAWMDAVRAFDVVDAARRSVRRRRTVEVSAGEVSERGQFKTKMTAVGCSLLSFTLVGVVLALLIGAVFDPRDAMQRQSEAAGFVFDRDAFAAGTADLTDAAAARLKDVSNRLRETPAEIIVEAQSAESVTVLDESRREAVVEFLRGAGGIELDSRVVVRPLAGHGFQRFMTGLWIVVFLPLGVFLALQVLILVTRSPDGGRREVRNGDSTHFES